MLGRTLGSFWPPVAVLAMCASASCSSSSPGGQGGGRDAGRRDSTPGHDASTDRGHDARVITARDGAADAREDALPKDAAGDAIAEAGSNAPGIFVAVGYGGRRVRSLDDGVTWIDDQALEDGGGDDTDNLRTVGAWSGGFIALGWRSMTSLDGNRWTDHGTVIGNWIGSVTYANGQLLGVGGYGLRATSTDGITWTNHSIDTVATHPGDGLAYGGGHYACANDDGVRTVSSDGVTWMATTGATSTLTTHLAYGNGIFLGIDGVTVVTSPDGAAWTVATPLPTAMGALLFASGTFTVIAAGHVYTSTNGAAWNDHAVTGIAASALAYGHGTYVLIDNTARRRSVDGITWGSAFDDGGQSLNWIGFSAAN